MHTFILRYVDKSKKSIKWTIMYQLHHCRPAYTDPWGGEG